MGIGVLVGLVILFFILNWLFQGDKRGCLTAIGVFVLILGGHVLIEELDIGDELNTIIINFFKILFYISFWDFMTDDPLAKSQGFKLMIFIFSNIMLLYYALWCKGIVRVRNMENY